MTDAIILDKVRVALELDPGVVRAVSAGTWMERDLRTGCAQRLTFLPSTLGAKGERQQAVPHHDRPGVLT